MNTQTHNSSLPLAGKIALVTGGSRSIGAAIVKRLAADGAKVAFTYVGSPQQAEETASAVQNAGGTALPILADSGDASAVRAAIAQVVATYGALDILVNNAGIALGGGPVDQIGFDDYQRMLAVNVTGVFVATQEAVRHMGQGGRIVHIGSSMTRYANFPGASLYTLTKGAVTGFNRSLARDLGPRGITVNNVQPGPVNTDMNPADGPMAGDMHGLMALDRHAHPDEIAGMVAYLAGPESGMVTGASLLIDGGFAA